MPDLWPPIDRAKDIAVHTTILVDSLVYVAGMAVHSGYGTRPPVPVNCGYGRLSEGSVLRRQPTIQNRPESPGPRLVSACVVSVVNSATVKQPL